MLYGVRQEHGVSGDAVVDVYHATEELGDGVVHAAVALGQNGRAHHIAFRQILGPKGNLDFALAKLCVSIPTATRKTE